MPMTEEVAMAVGTLLLPGEVRHMGGHDTGGATSATVGQVASTAAAIGQVVAVRILYEFPVGSYCCLLVDHCPCYALQQPPEQLSIRPAK